MRKTLPKDIQFMNHTRFPHHLNRGFLVFLLACSVMLSLIATAKPALAAGNPVIIRDTEIETMLKTWAEPVILASGLDPRAVNIILVQDSNINAFVAGGQNVFIYTGLITRSENASEIVGVIAHELGHIRGGHLIRTRGALESASYESLLGTILGIGAAVITGEGGLGAAISAGVSSTAANKFLAFSRVQESSADQAALDYMEKAKMNPQGLVTFMQKLEDQELLPASQQSEYMRTHPITRDRVSALEAGRSRSDFKDKAAPDAWKDDHDRMLAKLIGFITPEQVAWKYESRDKGIPAQYARAIAAYRQNRIDESLSLMDGLIAEEPQNAYFQELKGQMLVDYGRVEQALPYYKKSLDLLPSSSLIRTAYAHALIETAQNNEARLKEAIENLERAKIDERRSPRIQRLLATAHGRLGHEAEAQLYLAEEALLQNRNKDAKALAQRAVKGLPENSRPWIRAQDILNYVEQSDESN